MGITRTTSEEDGAEPVRSDRAASSSDGPTQQLVTAAVADRCSTCGAPMVSDQRYCLNCGDRRGRARFSFAQLANPAATAPAAPPPRRYRPSSGATLVAGIATLLLAMGVGVLIGHDSNGATVRQAATTPAVVTVPTGGGVAATPTSGGGPARHGGKAAHGKTAAVKTKKVVVTKKVAAAANAAAGKVLGSNSNLAPATTQVGASCSHGAGCQGGHFTGQFFGGG